MAPDADPYRTLGLSRGASLAEVKRAYRRLAKTYHPDAAGEGDLPRFLAIQYAYDQIVGPDASAGRPGTPRRPWDADPDRADATRRAYGGRARRTRTGPRRPAGGTSTGAAPGAGEDQGPRPGTSRPPGADGATRPPNKATLGSTSYDGAEAEPFEPDWGGASWYGTTSGTYWTLNPKEYADPRKHGPEYQARARRAAAVREAAGEPPVPPLDAEGTEGAEAPEGSRATDEPPAPMHTTGSWWDATAGPAPAAAVDPDADAAPVAGTASGDPVEAGAGWTWLEGDRPALPVRLGRAVLGWLPLAVAIGWLAGEISGCSRFAADCDPSTGAVAWLAQVGSLVILLAVPRLATFLATAALVAIGAAIPTALVLAAPGTGGGSSTAASALAVLVVVGWVVGLGVAARRAFRRGVRPVS